LWETNQITVAREHLATALAQFVMAQLFPLLIREETIDRGTAVVAGVQGELHQIGALMVADSLESDGWQVSFLGSNMPHWGILEALRQEKACLLGISTSILFNLPKAVDLIQTVRNSCPGVSIMVGGAAFKATNDLWKEAGADAFAPDLMAAVSVARQFSKETRA
jgi:methanogenic corrinoid protein MtbC1